MKVIDNKRVEGCYGGHNVWDILFDDKIDKELIDYIGKLGKLVYQGRMKKPFFKVIVRGKYTIKGSQGNNSVRVTLPEKDDPIILEEIKEYIELL